VNNLFLEEQKLFDAQIFDRKINKDIRKKIRKSMDEFITSDFKYPKEVKDRNRHVERNKESKRKHDIIKMQKLLETFFLKRENDLKVKELIAKRL
jgi:hypothetical protein